MSVPARRDLPTVQQILDGALVRWPHVAAEHFLDVRCKAPNRVEEPYPSNIGEKAVLSAPLDQELEAAQRLLFGARHGHRSHSVFVFLGRFIDTCISNVLFEA